MRRRLGYSIVTLTALLIAGPAHADDVSGNNIPNITYNADNGQLTILTDGADLISLLIDGPQATSIDRWQDGTNGDGVNGWAQAYFNGKEQWVGSGSAVSGGSVIDGSYDIATYSAGLTAADFGQVEVGTQSFGTLFTNISFGVGPVCDLDGDGVCDITDIDILTNQAGVTVGEIDSWLSDAGTENGKGGPYLRGDANLDGTVNATDLNAVGQSWQQTGKAWSTGDFNGDDVVNASDLNSVGQNWQQMTPMAAAPAAVPEPSSFGLLLPIFLGLIGLRRK